MKTFCKYSLSGGGNFNPTNSLIKGFLSLLFITTTLTACNEAEEAIPTQASNLNLSVKVNPSSRAMVQGTTLTSGQSVSVNVTAADGSNYDGKTSGYLNVAYTASGDGTQESPQTWAPVTNPILLSGTEGKMYVYYPWTDQADYKAIPVDVTTQTDWMYAEDDYTVSDTKANAEIILSHAQTAVSINVNRDASYTGAGLIEALTVTSEGLASAGTLDTRDGTFSNVSGANTAISIIDESFTLDGTTASSQENAYMLIPASDQTKDFTITATLDGKTYNHTVAMAEAFMPGKVYKVNVTFTNTGLKVSQVTLVDWDETTLPETTFEPMILNISKVYAVRKGDEALILPENIDTENEEYIAVALHVTGKNFDKKFMIEKNGESNSTSIQAAYTADGASNTGYTYFYWGMYGSDNASITNYTQTGGGGTSSYGYLPQADGSYASSSNNLSGDYTTWTSGALSDFNGKANTAAIQAASDTDSYTKYANMGTYCTKFNQTPYENQGYTDWYIPACGQLSLMFLNMADINAALTKIGGTTLASGNYWSSSEYSSRIGWYVAFDNGFVGNYNKNINYQVRFVRDF